MNRRIISGQIFPLRVGQELPHIYIAGLARRALQERALFGREGPPDCRYLRAQPRAVNLTTRDIARDPLRLVRTAYRSAVSKDTNQRKPGQNSGQNVVRVI